MIVDHVPVISYPALQAANFLNKKQSPKNRLLRE